MFQTLKNFFIKLKRRNAMKVKQATFTKQNGQLRTMRYLPVTEMTKQGILPKTINNSNTKTLKEGYELVWDFDKDGLRTINVSTIQGSPKEVLLESDVETRFRQKYLS